MKVDVAIVGGGPSGSTCGTLLKKYNPALDVAIFERETFPREHVGESQLPPISQVLFEMGCWDKVEAANFPIKVGATYRWGSSDDLWDFQFLVAEEFKSESRPARFRGQRTRTAFQVERALYDEILLNHAASVGCEVHQGTRVLDADIDGDRVSRLVLEGGAEVEARYFIDASGHGGTLRRALGVETDGLTSLQNIAIWSYWENTEWAVKIGVGGTRVQVLSLGYGWIWFIPLGPTRTSIGLVCPAEYYKQCGKRPDDLYREAMRSEPLIRTLTHTATQCAGIYTTKDWSFLSKRLVGENWFLVGEAAGFADPILAAGMTLAHWSGREAAYAILELDRGEHDPQWLKSTYEDQNKRRIWQHVRFADFWYSVNGHFTDLKEFCSEIARDAGFTLDANQAFQWLGTGGFINDGLGSAQIGTYQLGAIKQITQMFTQSTADWELNRYNVFHLNLEGAEVEYLPLLEGGRIERVKCFSRGGKRLPFAGLYKAVIRTLRLHSQLQEVLTHLLEYYKNYGVYADPEDGRYYAIQAMEAMLLEGWITGELEPGKPILGLFTPEEDKLTRRNRDNVAPDNLVSP